MTTRARAPIDEANLWELRLRARLRGLRLVQEIAIDRGLRDELRRLVVSLGRWGRDGSAIGRNHPAVLVTYLVAEGIFSYNGGTYWPAVAPPLGGHEGQVTGRLFEDSLPRLGLEPFESLTEPGVPHSRVGKILAHGGIPVYCLREFFALVLDEISRGLSDASEMLATWRESTWRLNVVAMPTQRFLLNGGDVAVDFLGRCIDLAIDASAQGRVPTPDEAGLPGYVVQALAELPDRERRPREVVGARAPRPSVILDPWSQLGPALEFPTVARESDYVTWTVEDGSSFVRRDGSTMTTERVPLAPARTWECEHRTADASRRRFLFEGLGRRPFLLFDPATGRMLRDPTAVSLEAVWVLAPKEAVVKSGGEGERPLAVTEVFPPLAGGWAGFAAQEVALDDVAELRVLHDGAEHAIRVVRRGQPELVGEVVEGVLSEAGETVYSAPPTLRLPDSGSAEWRGRIASGGRVVSIEPTQLAAGEVPLTGFLPAGVCSADLVLRGPLGSDARLSFCVVPELRVERPRRRLLTSRDGEIAVRVAAASGAVLDPETPLIAASADRTRVAARSTDGGAVGLVVHVPRLQWGLAAPRSGVVRLGGDPVRLDVSELTDAVPSILEVRTGLPSATLRLRLVERGRTAAETTTVHAPRGRWTFDLDQFGDTVRASQEQFLVVVVDADEVSLPVARIAREHQVWGLRAESAAWDGDGGRAEFAFSENQPFNGRTVRLWPRWRPWEGFLSAPIPDGATGACSLASATLTPGDYLAQIAVEDDLWVAPVRPPGPGGGVAAVRLGEPAETTVYLEGLDAAEPLAALEAARADGRRLSGLDRLDRRERRVEIALTALDAVADLPRGEPISPALATLADVLIDSPGDCLQALADLIIAGRVRHLELARITLRVLGAFRAAEPTPIDDESMRALWSQAPVLAVATDLPAAREGDHAANLRCDHALGWSPKGGEEPPVVGAVDALLLSRTADQLTDFSAFLSRLPNRMLDVGVYGPANLDWLIAQRRHESGEARGVAPARWWQEWHELTQMPLGARPCGLSIRVEEGVTCRAAAEGTPEWADIPQLSLVAAAHLVAGSEWADWAVSAIDEALRFCPRLVVSDVVRAVIFDELPQPPVRRDA